MRELDAYVAPATPPGQSGLAVIRIAGPDAAFVADRIFCFGPAALSVRAAGSAGRNSAKVVDLAKEGKASVTGTKSLAALEGYRAAYGHLISPTDGSLIDEAVALRFRAPHSYTGEDTVELSVHGGSEPVRQTLAACLAVGARAAEPGEFTRNAFLNGKLDLAQAEAVMDLIKSETDRTAQAALDQLGGGLSAAVRQLSAVLYSVMAELEMAIEYPEHEESELDREGVLTRLETVKGELIKLVRGYRCGKILKQGLQVVLTGSPNVGKSSLLNCLGGVERSIVTDVPGTTRDLVDLTVDLEGVPVCLTDTAGVRESDDPVEKIGITKANEALSRADLVLWLLSPDDCQSSKSGAKRDLMTFCRQELERLPLDKPILLVANKMDRVEFPAFFERLKAEVLPALAFTEAQLAAHRLLEKEQAGETTSTEGAAVPVDRGSLQPLGLSAVDGSGVGALTAAVLLLYRSWGEAGQQAVMVTSARHYEGLKAALELLSQVISEYAYIPLDIMAQVLAETARRLAEIVGDSVSEQLLDEIFSRFCVGK